MLPSSKCGKIRDNQSWSLYTILEDVCWENATVPPSADILRAWQRLVVVHVGLGGFEKNDAVPG